MTMNDVMDYAKYYNGKDEPPRFYHEHFDLKDKLFVPVDDVSLGKRLCKDTAKAAILHYFVADGKQNRLLRNGMTDSALHKKFYAVCSPDPSVDSANCWGCFNNANILKARITAYRWQQEAGERVILTLIWGDESTHRYAFDNIDKGAIVAVSHQGVVDEQMFKCGLLCAIDTIQCEAICWYGTIPEYIGRYYDMEKIVKMQPRYQLVSNLSTRRGTKTTTLMLFDDALCKYHRALQ